MGNLHITGSCGALVDACMCFLNILDWVINKFYFGSITTEVGKRDKEKMAFVLFSKPVNCKSTENQKTEHMSEFLNACRNVYEFFNHSEINI